MINLVLCDNGAYINVASVYRWFIDEDISIDKYTVQASIVGPQRPFSVTTRDSKPEAEAALIAILSPIAQTINSAV